MGRLCDGMNCPFNFEEKIISQAGCLLLVVLRCLKHFLLGLGKEDDRLHLNLAHASLSTISAGFPFTPPCLYSLNRRSASSIHDRSTSGSSSASKLLIRCSARRARSRGSRRNASCSSSCAFKGIGSTSCETIPYSIAKSYNDRQVYASLEWGFPVPRRNHSHTLIL